MNCDCYEHVNVELGKQGMKLSEKLFMFQVTEDLGLRMVMGLPLERLDGKRIQRKDPKMVQVSYCPVCGVKANGSETETQEGETETQEGETKGSETETNA